MTSTPNETKYYKSVDFEPHQEYTELIINNTNRHFLVNHAELVCYLLNYNKKEPIKVTEITADEYSRLFNHENYFGLDYIDDRIADLKIKEI